MEQWLSGGQTRRTKRLLSGVTGEYVIWQWKKQANDMKPSREIQYVPASLSHNGAGTIRQDST